MFAKVIATLALAAIIAAGDSQRPKPNVDPETREGFLIQQIQQEKDDAERLRLMEQFALQFPKHEAAAWVYDQLQPAYLAIKDWDQVIRIGDRLQVLEPDNVDTAHRSFRAAEAKQDPPLTFLYASRLRQIVARRLSRSGSDGQLLRQIAAYAEYAQFSAACAAADPKKRLELLKEFERTSSESAYVKNLPAEYFRTYRELGDDTRAIQIAEKTVARDSSQPALLSALVEHYFRSNDSHEKVVAYATLLIDTLEKKPAPENVNENEWQSRKREMVAMGNYMGGLAASRLNRFAKADAMLRASLPYLKSNEQMEAAAAYHLGVVNYRLAEAGERGRIQDALKFTRQCAAIKSDFQAQALKNIDAIKAEYNLQ